MNHFKLTVLIFSVILFFSVPAFAISIVNSKHDLSSGSTGATIKSTAGGTSEKCVFCHTPHSAKADAPLWNRNMSTAAYTLYNKAFSDVLNQLGGGTYPDAESPAAGVPHVKTRICLSCHDGTIGLGSLVNFPQGAPQPIPLQGAGVDAVTGQMLPAAAGYIGIDLRDDHPVAIPHNGGIAAGQDPELVTPILGGKVWLYDSSANKTATGGISAYVECTSCHNPHDNVYGNFLVDSNTGSAICTTCHAKTGFATSIHDTATLGYAPTNGASGNLGTTVGEVKCMDCHFPHKAGVTAASPTTPTPAYGKYLPSFQEEASCFNNPNDRWNTGGASGACHGSGAVGANAARRNIQSLVNETSGKPSKHRIENPATAGLHKATEGMGVSGYGWSNVATNWHAECADCHNPHTAGSGTRTVGSNTITPNTSPLYGVAGVNVAWPAGWTNPLGAIAYSYVTGRGVTDVTSPGVDMEYKICLKCHSDFAWGGPVSPAPNLTNQAQEFNPNNNAGYHPAVQTNPNRFPVPAGGWKAGSGFSNTSTMYCSDCHGNNDSAQAQGPHGSLNSPILKKVYGGAVVSSLDTTFLCFDCHDGNTYGSGGLGTPGTNTGFSMGPTNNDNLHWRHAGFGAPCKSCHVAIPHGWNNTRITSNRGMHLIDGNLVSAPYKGTITTTVGDCTNPAVCYTYVVSFAPSGSWATSNCKYNDNLNTGSTKDHTTY